MKKYLLLFLSLCIFPSNAWNTDSTTVMSKKHDTDYYGVIKTVQGNEFKVHNISIDGKLKQITIFEMPTKHGEPKIIGPKNGGSVKKEIPLEGDPREILSTSTIDPNEINGIIVPDPNTIWYFQKKKGYRKQKFIEIVVIKNNHKTKTRHLIPERTKVYGNVQHEVGPEEMMFPIRAIHTLTIDGFTILPKHKKHSTDQKNQNQKLACSRVKKRAGEPCISIPTKD